MDSSIEPSVAQPMLDKPLDKVPSPASSETTVGLQKQKEIINETKDIRDDAVDPTSTKPQTDSVVAQPTTEKTKSELVDSSIEHTGSNSIVTPPLLDKDESSIVDSSVTQPISTDVKKKAESNVGAQAGITSSSNVDGSKCTSTP